MRLIYLYILFAILSIVGCAEHKKNNVAPWGDTISSDTTEMISDKFSLADILGNGELIMLTLTGPDTYFDYHGRRMGTQYLMCEKFAHKLGVSLRVEVCKDTDDMINRLKNGEGDIIVYQMPQTDNRLLYCGYHVDTLKTSWAVDKSNIELADSVNCWYRPSIVKLIKREESRMYSPQRVQHRVYSPMLNASAGIISEYDYLFRKYAPLARWDWRLLAAQCYQESTFDPRAYSWAGACGLMQIMPSTAAQVGLSQSDIYDPEKNMSAAIRYIKMLNAKFQDIRDADERISFILASYNGGSFHIRDAMSLAKKYGRNPYKWSDVSEFVLKLSDSRFYMEPIVKHGYMRGTETVDYVESIRNRWMHYRRQAKGGTGFQGSSGIVSPQKARKKHRFKI